MAAGGLGMEQAGLTPYDHAWFYADKLGGEDMNATLLLLRQAAPLSDPARLPPDAAEVEGASDQSSDRGRDLPSTAEPPVQPKQRGGGHASHHVDSSERSSSSTPSV